MLNLTHTSELMFKGKEYEALSIVRKAQEDAEEWRRREKVKLGVVEKRGEHNVHNTQQVRSWRPPSANWIKCNFDGAWKKDRNNSGVGWICRGEKGHMLWAWNRA